MKMARYMVEALRVDRPGHGRRLIKLEHLKNSAILKCTMVSGGKKQ
jgi:hypothetical protein